MVSCNVDDILQPSDLFGKEILPECTFESEYGTLKLHLVVVPDFLDNEIVIRFEKCFDKIKAFMKEDDLLKKMRYVKIFASALTLYDRVQLW